MSFVSFGTHVFGDKTLQIPLHLFQLVMNGKYLSSIGFISIKLGLNIHGLSFKNRRFVRSLAKHSLKLNNTINTCLHYQVLFYCFVAG